MNERPRVEATPAGWGDLAAELDRWQACGRVAALWWRDDDAITATPQLELLLRVAGGVPVGLAVIPALARPPLAAAVSGEAQLAVLQHGWQHADRAGNGKKSEYPQGRSAAVVRAEIGAGSARLKALFGRRALPVFVPPWNRFGGGLVPLLAEQGIVALSAMASGPCRALPAGLRTLDVHLDLVAWRGSRGFIGTAVALAGLVGLLRARRLAAAAAPGPIGILTHHRIIDGATAKFLDRLIALTRAHAAVRWAAAAEFIR
ncbi:MAG TPA: hypothetical protein VND95_16865 [Stellaceae bacterium]|nr:hypothetical protein [Stellaceae bacterium]